MDRSPAYSFIRERVELEFQKLEKDKVTPWAFFLSGKPLRLTNFFRKEINYPPGIGFEGSPRTVFWKGFIQPFLQDIASRSFSETRNFCLSHNVEPKQPMEETAALLKTGIKGVYQRMSDIDQRLRGKGYPDSVSKYNPEAEIALSEAFVEERLSAELALSPKKRRTLNMNGQNELHFGRLRESLNAIENFREKRITHSDANFKTWRERTKQSLSELFGSEHDYTRRFSSLQFWDVRVTVRMRPGGPGWSSRDQETFDNDLERARALLTDALEEASIRPGQQIPPMATSAPTPSPQIVVNVINTLSQTIHVELTQILTTLDALGLPPDKLSQAKTHAKDLAEEAQGQQRWPVLAKTLDVLKSMGKSVYENVALPILLEMLKKQTGVGG